MYTLILALAPVLIILFYIYFRDKYEKEPLGLLLRALLTGAFITLPIILTEQWLHTRGNHHQGYMAAAYQAFIIAALTEETFKFAGLFLLVWRHRAFNEKFDGIVYGVFVSLGFAAVENILYVYEFGHEVAYSRALTAVPAHAVFGIVMGYYLSMARFSKKMRFYFLLQALLIPILLHGIYDFILMTEHQWLLLVFIPYLIYLWRTGFRRMRELSVNQ
ncbi:MAG: PrsW family intramembrane metalloprotease [Bacteroidales bacterium]|nr:PrsW family intramembrane metalloprotease [Bacteroidales bacterium]